MIKFTKMHGLGNDYICINKIDSENLIEVENFPSLARFMCNRHFGVGADGLILIDESHVADFKMSIYNKDGSQAQMCGNGIRCLAKYVYDYGLTQKNVIEIETLSGIKRAYLKTNQNDVTEVTVCMGEPILDLEQLKKENFIADNCTNEIKLTIMDKEFQVFPVSMGNPHAVIFLGKTDDIHIQKYGKLIENNNIFPQKTNVEFVQVIDRGHIKVKVWERGVSETYACGTGACAACSVCASKGITRNHVTVNLKGGDLYVNWDLHDKSIYLTGIVTKVFDGIIG